MTIITANFQKHLESKNYSRVSVKNYLCDARNFCAWVVSNAKRLSDLTSSDFSYYFNDLISKGKSKSTINRKKTSLKLFLQYLMDTNVISPDNTGVRVVSQKDLLSEYKRHLESEKTPSNTIKNYLSDTRGFLDFIDKQINN